MDDFVPSPDATPAPTPPTNQPVGFTLEEKQFILRVAHKIDKELTMRRWTRLAVVGLSLLGLMVLVILWLTLGQSLVDRLNSTIVS